MSAESIDSRSERSADLLFLFQLFLLTGVAFALTLLICSAIIVSPPQVRADTSESLSIVGSRITVHEARAMIASLSAIDWEFIQTLHAQYPFPPAQMTEVQGEFEVLSWIDAIHWGFDQVGIESKGNVGKSLVLVDQIPSLFAETDVVARACEEQVEMEEKMARFRSEALAIMVHEYAHLYLSHCDTPPFSLASFEEDDVLEWMAQQKESQAQILALLVLVQMSDAHPDANMRAIARVAVEYQKAQIAAHAGEFDRKVRNGSDPYADVTDPFVYGLIPIILSHDFLRTSSDQIGTIFDGWQ